MTHSFRRRSMRVLLSRILWTAAIFLGGCSKANPPIVSKQPGAVVRKLASPSQVDDVTQKVDACLRSVYSHDLPARCPNWIAFHAILMYGDSAYDAFVSGDANDNLNRAFSILLNSPKQQDGLFELRKGTPYCRRQGAHFSIQHHPCQFLNYFSMAGGPLSAVLKIDDEVHSVQELLDGSMDDANVEIELAYIVLAYSYYLEPGKAWRNKFGEQMSLSVLLERLLSKPEQTCLGTHRLAALARTLSREELKNDPEMRKLWPALETQVEAALHLLQNQQRDDGTFLPPGITGGSRSRQHQDIYYAGHSLEWITFLGKGFAREEWVVRSVEALVVAINATYQDTLTNMDVVGSDAAHYDFDALAHAVSGLRRWRDLVAANPIEHR